MTIITECGIASWVQKMNGVLLTRDILNFNSIDLSSCDKNTIVCLTGYDNIVNYFYNNLLCKFKNPIILILIETDFYTLEKNLIEHPLITHIYGWNIPIQHPKVSAIPIGLNYYRQGTIMNIFLNQHKISDKTQLLGINFSPNTNKIRSKLVTKAKTEWKPFCTFMESFPCLKEYWRDSYVDKKIKIAETNPLYYKEISKFKFVLSPPGAGVDCHRTWEALYLGCIPIVENSSINELYKDLPILVVNNWDDINEDLLERKYNEIMIKKEKGEYNMNKITLEYWIKKILNKKNSNIKIENTLSNKKIHFITYGNAKFERAKQRLLKEANEFGEFKSIKGYGPEDLSPEFKERFKTIVSQPRGDGYWIWRPYILKHAIDNINENEYLVYLDAGCKLNPMGKKRFNEYIKMFEGNDYGIMSFQMSGNNGPGGLEKEKCWTIKEIFKYFGIGENDNIRESGQYLGGILIMKKNKHLEEYLKTFIKVIEDNPLLCTDYYNKKNQEHFFRENRHEQSITSILRKKMGSIVIDGDESWITPFGGVESLKYPFWATRSNI
tara:strand:- start:1090 stop:2745 length:1656 start_codon:yes stop_codon:yes gene_type:complete